MKTRYPRPLDDGDLANTYVFVNAFAFVADVLLIRERSIKSSPPLVQSSGSYWTRTSDPLIKSQVL